ncbi:MAG TPA: glucosamine-6-phosphate deaminase, partial [Rugosimonospora sp.]|nr:glucosamine-6-phosphate deaminase [Rugosimonospora sp.]
MAADIAEQPEVFARLLAPERSGAIAEVAARVAGWGPRHVVFTARGTSDHAALYAAYLTEIRLGIPAGLA